MAKIPKHNSKEKGATMLEYGVMVALILTASVAVVRGLGVNLYFKLNNVNEVLAQGALE